MANRYRHFVLVGFRRADIKRNVVKTHSGRDTTSGKQNEKNVLFRSPLPYSLFNYIFMIQRFLVEGRQRPSKVYGGCNTCAGHTNWAVDLLGKRC
jgi:hypothetical protein